LKKGDVERFCGNCDSHNSYEYPVRIFCSTRYAQGKEAIVDTLWRCSDWNLVSQECYCVKEAQMEKKLRVRNGKVIT